MRPLSMYAKVKIDSTFCSDLVVKSHTFPHIMKGGYLYVTYDTLEGTAISMESEYMLIVVNMESLLTVQNDFMSAISDQVDLTEYIN